MSRFSAFFLTFLLLPFSTQAAASAQEGIREFFGFINSTLMPFLIGIAFLFVVINVFRLFIVGAASEESRKKAKTFAIYSVGAFVVIIIFWGTVNLLSETLGLNDEAGPTIDYFDAYDGESPTFKNRQGTPNTGGETTTP